MFKSYTRYVISKNTYEINDMPTVNLIYYYFVPRNNIENFLNILCAITFFILAHWIFLQ